MSAPSTACGLDEACDSQTLIFGCLVSKLFDSIHNQIDPILREGISTLPLLSASDDDDTTDLDSYSKAALNDFPKTHVGRRDKLFHLMHSSYAQNLDLVELYATRNIFTLDGPVSTQYTRRQKAEIIRRFHEQEIVSKDILESESARENRVNNFDSDLPSVALDLTSGTVPSVSEIEQLQRDLETTRNQLRQAVIRKNVLDKHLQILNQYSSQTLPWMKQVLSTSIEMYPWHAVTQEIMEESKHLRNLVDKGQDRIHQLKVLGNVQGDNNALLHGEETMEFGQAMKDAAKEAMEERGAVLKKQKTINLEEDFAQRRSTVVDQDLALNSRFGK